MKQVAIVYWSGTGNTQAMAEAVAEGARAAGASVTVTAVAKASREQVLGADAAALGCPSMGVEVLEESEMEPFVQALEGAGLQGKPLALFGSYDWGDGQWLRDWQERMAGTGARLVADGLAVNNTPDETGLAQCKELGAKLAAAAE
ncbi:flavodoxin short chain [Hydrogenispora ethanolica]|jgi:flavodoxin short chain|uniref:Flavodoxin n=1 Tax=Hydrogenispora ethanolica TaxID=1082276 RepID=A0A4R1SBN5_HYDET|nr:flavodoxin [Hydrogenispora ethanolica]TCL76966.1 flavodoxin short chain [Hydrogenispora ethanolica]